MKNPEGCERALSLNKISKKFGDKVIFDNFSYDFDRVGLYVLIGESGIGKTTLLRIISGLDNDFGGHVIGGGSDNVSVCFQEHRLFPHLSALENLTKVSFDRATDNDVNAAKNMLYRLKLSTSDILLKPKALSGGMKQRISFARAVIKDAPILILDEPTKEVDSEVTSIMRRIIEEEAERRCVIVVTHNPEDLNLSKARIIKIESETQ